MTTNDIRDFFERGKKIAKLADHGKPIPEKRDAMLRSFLALSSDPTYLKEAQEIEENLNLALPAEPKEWWKG